MKLAEKQRFILFVLGKIYDEANRKLKDRILEVSVSKSAFIEVVMGGGLAKKKERALYKNLESLEKSKLISYENKVLKLTKKGQSVYSQIDKDLAPYVEILKVIERENVLKFTSKAKTIFRASL
ncbi:MAG: hypothetical protein HY512_01835 [Candidatus Aenigmarchaeota archaeon]|nr:hypothetical protein [Candidatus Aenigmarchaeota archaeon]